MRSTAAADSIAAMIPEASTAATLEVSIVLHESKLDVLRDTLESLFCSVEAARDAGVLEVFFLRITDNGSSVAYRSALAGLLDSLAPSMPSRQRGADGCTASLHLEELDKNRGFGAGHNQALCAASGGSSKTRDSDPVGRIVLILNPDVELAPDALVQALTGFATNPRIVAANPRCTGSEGRREFLCKRYPTVGDLFLRGFGGPWLQKLFAHRLMRYEYRELDDDRTQPVELLSGACFLCRGSAFDQVGGFDPHYFMYFEDFDLSLRLAGFGELVYLPRVQIVHHGGYAAQKGRQHVRWFGTSAYRFFCTHGWKFF